MISWVTSWWTNPWRSVLLDISSSSSPTFLFSEVFCSQVALSRTSQNCLYIYIYDQTSFRRWELLKSVSVFALGVYLARFKQFVFSRPCDFVCTSPDKLDYRGTLQNTSETTLTPTICLYSITYLLFIIYISNN